MIKQTSTPYTGKLLALCTYGWSGMHRPALQRDINYSPPIALSSWWCRQCWAWPVADDRFTVVRNINSFERELLRYGYAAMRLQYHYIQYDMMYCAITKNSY